MDTKNTIFGTKVDLVGLFDKYSSTLKNVYTSDISLEKPTSSGICCGTDLKIAGYKSYRKDKQGMQIERCSAPSKKKLFCRSHLELSDVLHNMNHEAEKLYDSELKDVFNGSIGRSKIIRKYVRKCMNDDAKRINILVLFFSLQYDIIVRKERNSLCYSFSKDKGHIEAVELRERALNIVSEIVDLKDHSNMNFHKVCRYYDVLSENYNIFKILSFESSRKFLNLLDLDIGVPKNRVFLDIISLIKKLHSKKILERDNGCRYFDIRELLHSIYKDNPLSFENENEKLVTYVKTYEKKEEEVFSLDVEILTEEEDAPSDEEQIELVFQDEGYDQSEKNKLRELSRIKETSVDSYIEYQKFFDRSIDELKKIFRLYREREVTYASAKKTEEKLYLEAIKNYKENIPTTFKSINEYSDNIDNEKKRVLSYAEKSNPELNDYFRFLTYEKNITVSHVCGDFSIFEENMRDKVKLFDKFLDENEVKAAEYILSFICNSENAIMSNYCSVILFDHYFSMGAYKSGKFYLKGFSDRIRSIDMEIRQRVRRYIKLIRTCYGYLSKAKKLMDCMVDVELGIIV